MGSVCIYRSIGHTPRPGRQNFRLQCSIRFDFFCTQHPPHAHDCCTTCPAEQAHSRCHGPWIQTQRILQDHHHHPCRILLRSLRSEQPAISCALGCRPSPCECFFPNLRPDSGSFCSHILTMYRDLTSPFYKYNAGHRSVAHHFASRQPEKFHYDAAQRRVDAFFFRALFIV